MKEEGRKEEGRREGKKRERKEREKVNDFRWYRWKSSSALQGFGPLRRLMCDTLTNSSVVK